MNDLIDRFYAAFSARDAAGMSACYHPNVQFGDPAFPDLKGFRAAAMWHMLCERGKDLTLEHSDVKANADAGSARWNARYTFGATGRMVHNVIDAEFTFGAGRILTHRDTFDFWRWTRMALGAPGVLLGWTPFLKNKVQAQAGEGLHDYIAKKGLDASLIPPL